LIAHFYRVLIPDDVTRLSVAMPELQHGWLLATGRVCPLPGDGDSVEICTFQYVNLRTGNNRINCAQHVETHSFRESVTG